MGWGEVGAGSQWAVPQWAVPQFVFLGLQKRVIEKKHPRILSGSRCPMCKALGCSPANVNPSSSTEEETWEQQSPSQRGKGWVTVGQCSSGWAVQVNPWNAVCVQQKQPRKI